MEEEMYFTNASWWPGAECPQWELCSFGLQLHLLDKYLYLFSMFIALQKWHCVEEIAGKLRIQKCKDGSKEGTGKRTRSLKPGSSRDNREKVCDCEDTLYKPSRMDRRSHRQLSSSAGQRECPRPIPSLKMTHHLYNTALECWCFRGL